MSDITVVFEEKIGVYVQVLISYNTNLGSTVNRRTVNHRDIC